MVYLKCHETLFSASIRLFGRCHHSYMVCYKHFGAMSISWKNCLLLGQHTVDCISYKAPHKLPCFARVRFCFSGKILFLHGYVEQLILWICCVFHGNHKVHNACKALTNLRFIFIVLFKARCS